MAGWMKITLSTAAALLLSTGAACAEEVEKPNYSEARAAQLQQNYTPKPAIWRLSDGDTTIYLFGTIHMIPKGFRWRTASFNGLLNEVDELVLETPSREAMTASMEWASELQSNRNTRPNLSSRLSETSRAKLDRLATQSDIPIDMLERLPLWMTVSAISAKQSDDTDFGRNFGVEVELEAQFDKLGKPVSGIENPLWVLRRLSSFDDDALLQQFEKAMAEWEESETLPSTKEFGFISAIDGQSAVPGEDGESFDSFAIMLHDWAKGDVAAMEDGLTIEQLGPGFYDALIGARNRNWAIWVDNRMDRPGTLMLAVGAGHLSGTDSLITLLEQRGFKPKRIQ